MFEAYFAKRGLHPWAQRFNWILGAVLLVVLVAGGFTKGRWVDTSNEANLEPGLKVAPAFSLETADGKKVSLASLRDHVVVVHFWAAWCPPCLPEIPEILAAAKKMPKDRDGRPIYWVLVTQDESWEKAHRILPESSLTENVISVRDPDAKVSDAYGSYQFPETYLLTRYGRIAAKWIGPQEWSGGWGEQALYGIEHLSRTKSLPSTTPTGK